jgi:hypothetical protein
VHAVPHDPLRVPARLAGLALAGLAVWAADLRLAAAMDWSPVDALRWLAIVGFGALLAGVAVSGLAPVALRRAVARPRLPRFGPRGPAPVPAGGLATHEQRQALRWMGDRPAPGLTQVEATRRIRWLESRLPATLAQQRALAAWGSPRGVYTRASAARFLAERAAEADWQAAEDWADRWAAVDGPLIEWPGLLPADERAAFDAAAAALAGQGLAWEHRPLLHAVVVGEETARMARAAGFLAEADAVQRRALAAGELRRPVPAEALRRVFPDFALLLEAGDAFVAAPSIWLALLQKAQPGVLAPAVNGFRLAADLRAALAECRERRAQELAAAAALADEDEDDDEDQG